MKPGMSSHFSESRDPSYVGSAMYIQNVAGKNGELSFGLQSVHPLESGPDGVTTSPTLLGPVLVWKQQNYLKLHVVDGEVFRVLLGLLSPRLSPKEKRASK